ncbi:MAG: DUF3579 domain-containing protein [Proteobacteria bacterium]|nr:MAG: DUF3579 domain-containing protein [Pseudomonadota bacterium]
MTETFDICYLDEIIIEGQTESGKRFRPSDWVDRLCCILADFQDKKFSYSPYLRPMMFRNMQCVAVKRQLADLSPEVFNYIMQFAKDNHLVITDCANFMKKAVEEK